MMFNAQTFYFCIKESSLTIRNWKIMVKYTRIALIVFKKAAKLTGITRKHKSLISVLLFANKIFR